MAQQNRYLESLSSANWAGVWFLVSRPVIEIFYGITSKSINWFICLGPGLSFNILIIFHLDTRLFKWIGLGFMLPPGGSLGYLIYSLSICASGFLGWGFWQSILYLRVSRRLTEVFQTSGLKNAIGKMPSFVFDKPIDEFTRKMRLTRANLPMSHFTSAKESLESALQVYIDELKENREGGTVDITYASQAIPTEVKLQDIKVIGRNKFVIGETRARQITFDFDETPHLLVGGQSGGGKSTFLRQMITTLYLNNRTYRFYLIDLKGGLEFQIFEGLDRVTVVPQASTAIDYLARLESNLKQRMEVLKAAGCKDIAAYLTLPDVDRQTFEATAKVKNRISRIITVIDEAAELFMAGEKAQAANAQRAKAMAIKIAAQGRAVGIHLIVATQRPDVRAVDGQIKANLSGALAFQMPNYASSMTILDNTRAAHLPKVPGRAVWKTGLEMVELQTPFVTVDEVNGLLSPFRITKPEATDE